MNCEIANQKKVEESAKRQIEEINYILDKNIELKEGLKLVIKLRLDNPQDSLQELASKSTESVGVEISRNSINHRLRELHEIYVSIKNTQE